jgi:hypothetical protein
MIAPRSRLPVSRGGFVSLTHPSQKIGQWLRLARDWMYLSRESCARAAPSPADGKIRRLLPPSAGGSRRVVPAGSSGTLPSARRRYGTDRKPLLRVLCPEGVFEGVPLPERLAPLGIGVYRLHARAPRICAADRVPPGLTGQPWVDSDLEKRGRALYRADPLSGATRHFARALSGIRAAALIPVPGGGHGRVHAPTGRASRHPGAPCWRNLASDGRVNWSVHACSPGVDVSDDCVPHG